MKMATISTKEIRNNLERFLQHLKHGEKIRVMYRSKPVVTIGAVEDNDPFLAKDAGTPAAARRSAHFVKSLTSRPVTFDPDKSFKELYKGTKVL